MNFSTFDLHNYFCFCFFHSAVLCLFAFVCASNFCHNFKWTPVNVVDALDVICWILCTLDFRWSRCKQCLDYIISIQYYKIQLNTWKLLVHILIMLNCCIFIAATSCMVWVNDNANVCDFHIESFGAYEQLQATFHILLHFFSATYLLLRVCVFFCIFSVIVLFDSNVNWNWNWNFQEGNQNQNKNRKKLDMQIITSNIRV